jgi:branched-chain amino acid transport system substrate-binding protein
VKRTKTLIGLAASSLMLAGCSGADGGGAADDEIVLGIVTDTSGGASAYAPYTGVGIDIAIEEINEAGGIDGKKIRVISKNDGSDTTQTPTIARRLIDDGAQVLILNSGSASAIASKVVCVEEDIVCVAPTNLSASIVEAPDNENIYILGPTSSGIGDSFAQGMNAAGYKKLAVIADDVSTIQDYATTMMDQLEDAGIEPVALEKVATDAADASAQIARVEDAEPDVVLVMSLGGQTEALIQNGLHRAMPGMPRFSLASIGNQPDTWDLASSGALEDLVFAGSIDPANNRTTDFEKKLTARGGKNSALTAYGPQGYDAVQLIKQAITAAGGAEDREAVQEAFESISDYKPHYGQNNFTISFSADKHVGADGSCGLVLAQFDAQNKPTKTWSEFQPSC